MLESACCGCKYYSKCGKPDRERKCLGYENSSHREKKMRLICFCDGTGMGDYLYVVNTNAPMTELKELERKSCQVYLNGGSYEDIPIWAENLGKKGYEFNFIDEHIHVSAYKTSGEWLKENYSDITEKYIIENQSC